MRTAELRVMAKRAVVAAADVMENVDPDDRSPAQDALVRYVKTWMVDANNGDAEKARLLVDAVPEWGHSPSNGKGA